MRITDITPQKYHKNRVSVFVDDEYSFSLEDTDMIRLKVKIGNEITMEDIDRFNKECNLTKAKNRVMDMLNRRAITKKALVDDLKKRGYDKEICIEAVDEFSELGYINDEFFATEYAKDAHEVKNHGRIRIISDLIAKGVPNDLAKKVLDELDFDEEENIANIINSRFENTDFSDYKEKNRVVRYLATRGYNFSEIFSVIDKIKNKDVSF